MCSPLLRHAGRLLLASSLLLGCNSSTGSATSSGAGGGVGGGDGSGGSGGGAMLVVKRLPAASGNPERALWLLDGGPGGEGLSMEIYAARSRALLLDVELLVQAPTCAMRMVADFVQAPDAPVDTACVTDVFALSFDAPPEQAQLFFGRDDLWD
ncbi:MAG: hypothetical protein R3B72_39100 [Polyangiaceae bacterium]